MEISKEQAEYREKILERFIKEWREKYDAGAVKYGTNIWEYPLKAINRHAIEEALDLVSYLYTEAERIDTEVKKSYAEGFRDGREQGRKDYGL